MHGLSHPLVDRVTRRLTQGLQGLQGLRRPAARTLTVTLTSVQREAWEDHGFLVLPGFFGAEEIDPVNEYVDRLWRTQRNVNEPIVLDYLLETDRAGRSLLRDGPDGVRNWPYKLNDLYLTSEEVRNLVLAPRLCAVLAELLEGEPMAINTLNFERGSQQADHYDTFFMPAPIKNKMVATWIALEDIHPQTGPLQYYAGSNQLEPYRFSHGQLWAVPEEMPVATRRIRESAEAAKLRPTTFTPEKGDVFIWHSQLMHGGSPIGDLSRTRQSVVTHYFRTADFDTARRGDLQPEELRGQFEGLNPAWRAAFVRPAIRRTPGGQAYLDKWAIAPLAPGEALTFGCAAAPD